MYTYMYIYKYLDTVCTHIYVFKYTFCMKLYATIFKPQSIYIYTLYTLP